MKAENGWRETERQTNERRRKGEIQNRDRARGREKGETRLKGKEMSA